MEDLGILLMEERERREEVEQVRTKEQQQQQQEGRSKDFGEEGGARKEKAAAEWGREWNGKVKGEVGNEDYLI